MKSRDRRLRWERSVRCVRRAYQSAGLPVPRVGQLAGLGFWQLCALLHGAEEGVDAAAIMATVDKGLYAEVKDDDGGARCADPVHPGPHATPDRPEGRWAAGAWEDYAALCGELRAAGLVEPLPGEVVNLAAPFRRRLLQMAHALAQASSRRVDSPRATAVWRTWAPPTRPAGPRTCPPAAPPSPTTTATRRSRPPSWRHAATASGPATGGRPAARAVEDELCRRRMELLRSKAPEMAGGMFPGCSLTPETMLKVRQMVQVIAFEPGIDTNRLASLLGYGGGAGETVARNARARVRELSLVASEAGFLLRHEPGGGPYPARWYLDQSPAPTPAPALSTP
jgi:hypothetical protein